MSSAPRTGPQILDYARTLDCIHCGLCLNSCPTYRLSGREDESPRGRIHLMRAQAEGRLEADPSYAADLESGLVCRNCETVCPAGVEFGALMETAREALPAPGSLGRLLRWIGFGRVLPSRRLLGLAAGAIRLTQSLGLVRLVAPLLGARGRALAATPAFPPAEQRRPLPARTPARGERLGACAVLEGCVQRELFGRVNRATARVLSAAGDEVHACAEHACCGALHAHNGELEGARALARETIARFEALVDRDGAPLPVVVNSAGCGAHMREYGRLLADDPAWAARADAFGARVRDLSEHLAKPSRLERLKERLKATRPEDLPGPVAWDDPCHLCHGQGVRDQPRALLAAIPGLDLRPLQRPEACCGSAGIHALLHPEDSAAVLAEKLDDLEASGATSVVTANPGCQMHWQGGLTQRGGAGQALHLAEVLDRCLGNPDGG